MSAFDPAGLTVYVNGELVDGPDAKVSVFDKGLLYGDGVFDALRVCDGALFRPREHLARLAGSARALAIDVPVSQEELLAVVVDVCTRCGVADGVVRIVLTRGFGAPGMDPGRAERPTLIVTAYAMPPLLGSAPLRVLVSSVPRKSPRSLGAHVKSLNYLDSILARQQAAAAGMDEAIMLDLSGAVAETAGANVFAVLDGVLVTPTTRAALPGITRRTVLELAAEDGLPAVEREVWPFELYTADAVFLTGTGCGVMPVAELDGRALQSAAHPVVALLAERYAGRLRDPRLTVSAGLAAPRP